MPTEWTMMVIKQNDKQKTIKQNEKLTATYKVFTENRNYSSAKEFNSFPLGTYITCNIRIIMHGPLCICQ